MFVGAGDEVRRVAPKTSVCKSIPNNKRYKCTHPIRSRKKAANHNHTNVKKQEEENFVFLDRNMKSLNRGIAPWPLGDRRIPLDHSDWPRVAPSTRETTPQQLLSKKSQKFT